MTDAQLTEDMLFLDREFRKVVESHFGVRLKHDRPSMAELDRLFAGPLAQLAQDDFRSASVMTAAYLGETVRALAGGHWHHDLSLGPGIADVPGLKGFLRVLARAEKRIQSGGSEALMDFLQAACPLRH